MKRTALRRRTSLKAKAWNFKRKFRLNQGTTFLKRKVRLKKHSASPLALLEKAIWALCKAIVRAIYPNTCYTCGQTNLRGRNWQTGHMWPKATLGAYLKYDLRVLRPQCYHCNIDLGGNGAIFFERMQKELGQEKMAELLKDKMVSVHAHTHYANLYIKYQELHEGLTDLKDKT